MIWHRPTPSSSCPLCGAELADAGIRVDLAENVLLVGNHAVALQASWAELAHMLVQKMPGVVTREQIYNGLYGLRTECEMPEPKIIDVFICHLRKALADTRVRIETVWGRGYRMVVCDDA